MMTYQCARCHANRPTDAGVCWRCGGSAVAARFYARPRPLTDSEIIRAWGRFPGKPQWATLLAGRSINRFELAHWLGLAASWLGMAAVLIGGVAFRAPEVWVPAGAGVTFAGVGVWALTSWRVRRRNQRMARAFFERRD